VGKSMGGPPEGLKTDYMKWLEGCVETLEGEGETDCHPSRFPDPTRPEQAAPELTNEQREAKEGRVSYPPIECSACGETFQRVGPGQGKRVRCYECHARGDHGYTVKGDKVQGAALAKLRKRAGLGQRPAGELFGVSTGTYYRWEKGIRPIPAGVLETMRLRANGSEEPARAPEPAETQATSAPAAPAPPAPARVLEQDPPAEPDLRLALKATATSSLRRASVWLSKLAARIEAR